MDTPKKVDEQLYQIQTHLVRAAGPLVVLLDGLQEDIMAEPDAVVLATAVLDAVKATLHLVGST